MENKLSKTGATVRMFEDEDSRGSAARTYPVFGCPRGGTTAVARCVGALGIFMGDDMGVNFEDPLFGAGNPKKRDTVKARNKAHSVWGWKFPNAVNYLDAIAPALRNPRYICVTRDVTANGLGISARDKNFDDVMAVERSLQNTQRNFTFLLRQQRPSLLVSYEKLIMKPEEVLADLSDFLGVSPSQEQLDFALDGITPGRYRPAHEKGNSPKPAGAGAAARKDRSWPWKKATRST